jgi:hypothetical protein
VVGKKSHAWSEALLVFLVVLCLYLPFLSQQFDLNGITEAVAVDNGDLFSANHLLYRPLGLLATRFATSVGFTGKSIAIFQVLSAMSGAACVALAFLFFHGLIGNRAVAAIAALWLAGTWTYWAFSTDAMYMPVGASFVAGAAVALLRHGRLSAIVCGALLGFAVTTWEANVLLVPLFVAGVFLFRTGDWQGRLRLTGHLLWACAIPIVTLYFIAASAHGHQTPRAIFTWLTSHGNGVVLPMWGRSTGQGLVLPQGPPSIASFFFRLQGLPGRSRVRLRSLWVCLRGPGL